MEFGGEPSKVEKSITLAALGNELAEYFDEHSIYFSKSTCSKFESLFKSIRDPSMRFSTVLHMAQQYPEDRDLAKMKREAWTEGAQKFREEVPPLKEALADDFREILGVEEQVGDPTT
jgi:tRNA A37 methylthiotransferase MiaB